MAIDGTGILESDLAHDIYNDFLDLYDSDLPIAEIRQRIEAWRKDLMDDLEQEIYLSVYCQALWEVGELNAKDLAAFRALVETEAGLKEWLNLGSDHCLARRKVLLKQLGRLSKPRAKPRPRKRYRKVTRLLFEVGDCLVYRHSNGKSYPLLVCDVFQYRGDCLYSMVPVETGLDGAATLERIAQGQFIGHKIGYASHPQGFVYGFFVVRPEHRELIRFVDQFAALGRLEIRTEDAKVGTFGGVLTKEDFEHEIITIIRDHEKTGSARWPMKAVVFQPGGAGPIA